MFDTLTDDERTELRTTIYRGARKTADVGHALCGAGLALTVCTPERAVLMDQGRRFYAVMYDLHELRADMMAA